MTEENEFEEKMGNLGARIDRLMEKSKEHFQSEGEDLKRGWELLEERRKAFAAEAKEKWEDVKDGMNEGFENVERMYEDLKRKVGE